MKEESMASGRDIGDWELLQMLKRDLEKIPLLTREEETAVARRVRIGEQEAVDLLVRSNIRFVVHVVFKFWHPGLSVMDLISEGCIGILKAAKTFDPEMGFRFVSYAHDAIAQRVHNAIRDHYRNKHDSLDAPVSDDGDETTLKDLLSSDDSMAVWLDRCMSKKEQPETAFPECPVCHRQIDRDSRTCSHCQVGFQKPRKGEHPSSFKSGSNHPTGYGADEPTVSKRVYGAFSVLDSRERRIIVLQYWLGLDRSELAKKMGLSQTRVAQLENRALRKMRWELVDGTSADHQSPDKLSGLVACEA